MGRPRYYRFVTVIYGMTRNPVIARPALQSAALSWENSPPDNLLIVGALYLYFIYIFYFFIYIF